MADHMTVSKILGEIDQLSYSDRMKVVESVVRSLRLGEAYLPNEQPRAEASENPEELFGIWRERDVTLAGIRERAWHRR